MEHDYSPEVREQRRLLVPFLKEARAKGQFAVLVKNKLKINENLVDLEYCRKNRNITEPGAARRNGSRSSPEKNAEKRITADSGEVTEEKSNRQNLQRQQSNVWNRSTHESALTGQLTAGIHDSTQGRRDEEGLRSSERRGGTARDMSNEVTVSSPNGSLMTLTSGRENKSYNLRNWCMTGDGNTSKGMKK